MELVLPDVDDTILIIAGIATIDIVSTPPAWIVWCPNYELAKVCCRTSGKVHGHSGGAGTAVFDHDRFPSRLSRWCCLSRCPFPPVGLGVIAIIISHTHILPTAMTVQGAL